MQSFFILRIADSCTMLSAMNREARMAWIEGRIERVKQALNDLDEMRPGSISKQYNVCGSPGCRCKDPRKPKRHGPYYQLSYMHKGQSSSQFIRRELLPATRQQLANYKAFRKLTDEWVSLALEHAKLKLEIGRER